MRKFSVEERRNRLARRHFLCHAGSVSRVTAGLVGLHATDPATPYLSLRARCRGFRTTDLDRVLYEKRSAVKHLAMRRTLWVVNSDDLPLVQSAASGQVADTERRRLVADLHKAGVTTDGERWLDQARAAVVRHLAEHGPASSTELRNALPELAGSYDPAPGKRWGGSVPVAPRVLTVLSAGGDIVRGPNDGNWTASRPRWSATADWLGQNGDPIPEAAARAELIRRWLQTFGPATVNDIKWWFGTTLTAVRAALATSARSRWICTAAPATRWPTTLAWNRRWVRGARCYRGWTPPRWAGLTGIGIWVRIAGKSSTATATPDPRRGGTDA